MCLLLQQADLQPSAMSMLVEIPELHAPTSTQICSNFYPNIGTSAPTSNSHTLFENRVHSTELAVGAARLLYQVRVAKNFGSVGVKPYRAHKIS